MRHYVVLVAGVVALFLASARSFGAAPPDKPLPYSESQKKVREQLLTIAQMLCAALPDPPAPNDLRAQLKCVAAEALLASAGDPATGLKRMADETLFGPKYCLHYLVLAGEAQIRAGHRQAGERYFDEAFKLLNTVLLRGFEGDSFGVVTDSLVRSGQEQRLEVLVKTVHGFVRDENVRSSIVRSYLSMDNLDAAIRHARQIPQDAGEWRSRALIACAREAGRLGSPQLASPLYLEALQTGGSHPRPIQDFIRLLEVLRELGAHKEILSAVRPPPQVRLVDEPNVAILWGMQWLLSRGEVDAATGLMTDLRDDFQGRRRVTDSHVDAHLLMAQYHGGAGNPKECARYLASALDCAVKLYKDGDELQYQRIQDSYRMSVWERLRVADVQRSMGDAPGAAAVMNQAAEFALSAPRAPGAKHRGQGTRPEEVARARDSAVPYVALAQYQAKDLPAMDKTLAAISDVMVRDQKRQQIRAGTLRMPYQDAVPLPKPGPASNRPAPPSASNRSTALTWPLTRPTPWPGAVDSRLDVRRMLEQNRDGQSLQEWVALAERQPANLRGEFFEQLSLFRTIQRDKAGARQLLERAETCSPAPRSAACSPVEMLYGDRPFAHWDLLMWSRLGESEKVTQEVGRRIAEVQTATRPPQQRAAAFYELAMIRVIAAGDSPAIDWIEKLPETERIAAWYGAAEAMLERLTGVSAEQFRFLCRQNGF